MIFLFTVFSKEFTVAQKKITLQYSLNFLAHAYYDKLGKTMYIKPARYHIVPVACIFLFVRHPSLFIPVDERTNVED